MFTEDQARRYEAAAHAMQSGVAQDQADGSTDGTPKHLRVGINSAMAEGSAVARLLIAKGIFSEEEYCEAIISGMEVEVALYEKRLTERHGVTVKLA